MKIHMLLLPLLILLATATLLTAVPGDLDTTFGGMGKVTTPIGSGDELASGVAMQSDGKIVVAGDSVNGANNNFAVVRYNADGSLDTSFNGTGKVTTAIGSDDHALCVAVQSDGKIVAGGYSGNFFNRDFVLVRYNADGTLDASFNGTGKVITDFGGGDEIASIAVQGDGKIVAVGYTYTGAALLFALARYNTDGSLDTSFNGTGMVTTAVAGDNDVAQSVAVQSDGKIVVAGYTSTLSQTPTRFALVRYNVNGTLDTSFNGSGKVVTIVRTDQDAGRSVVVQGDGKIVLAGESRVGGEAEFAVARYNPNGSLDTTFNGTGKVTTTMGNGDAFVGSVALQASGRILVAGTSDYPSGAFALVRFNDDGSLDTSFNSTGRVITTIGSASAGNRMALQTDGKIVVAGYASNGSNYDFAVVRYEVSPLAITVEQPAGTHISNGGARNIVAAAGTPETMIFTIKNHGTTDLTGLGITIDGTNAADFSVTSNPTAPVAPGGSTAFAVQFSPSLPASESAALHLASNDVTGNPFNINLTGQVLLTTVDTDGDGMSDATEFMLSCLGFDWQVAQPAKVSAFLTNTALYNQTQYNANRTAGRNDVISSPNTYSLYTLSQVQGLNVGAPLLTKSGGTFKLTLGIQKSVNLAVPNGFTAFPMTAPQCVINAQGKLEFTFTVPDNAAFFRVQAQ